MIYNSQNREFAEYIDPAEIERIKSSSKAKTILLIILMSMLVITTSLLVYLANSVYKTTSKLNSMLNVERYEQSSDKESEFNKVLDKLIEIDKYYELFYVGEIDYEDTALIMGNALIAAYGDKYGAYFDEEYALKQIEKNNSSLYGIGILVRAEENKQLYVIESYDGPAKRAGIEAGCIITKVNGEELDLSTNESYNDVISKIKGELGTSVEITFINNKGVENTVEVEREKVTTTSVNYQIIDDSVGYVLIREFAGNTDEEFEKALKDLKAKGINKVIYDVRGNSGGLLNSVANMIDLILPKGDTIYIVDANDKIVETYKSDNQMIEFEETIVLVDKDSASASELFTQSLKEFEIATVIGETTFGKGTVCSEYELSDNDMIMLSTYKYLTNSKECIEGIGVKPDIEFVLDEDEANILYKLPVEEDDVIAKALDVLY